MIKIGGDDVEYYSITEVSKMFKISRQAVHKWIKEKKIKAERIGEKLIRIPKDEVEKLRSVR